MQQSVAVRIAFIGGGNMARALIGGLKRHAVPAEHISVGEPDAQARAGLQRDFGIRVSADNQEMLDGAQLVVLAVKPQQAGHILQALRPALQASRPLLFSIAAGLRIADLRTACGPGIAIVRAMPNRPALLGAGVTGLFAAPGISAEQHRDAELIGQASGQAVWLRSEDELDVVTALSGAGPAYFFLLAEKLAHAAEGLGLTRDTALQLARATLHGAGMLANEGVGLVEERAAVTSKGGTTEAAVRVLEQGGFTQLVASALQAGVARSAELANSLSATTSPERK
ncbi:MAG TPA: pyrroline-5-carboxylate reductase [Steroidobacteraceae bacterium]|jgi:pyrroline-5-carboxylate reductase|nr:pyrroline-5-carboxylate reductase [Steroidobacteraceae bacterium]